MKSDQWNTYRTRFLIKAKQLSSPLSFSDHLGRQHHGRKGDYLVESCDGVVSIAPRQIFEDIYVPMSLLDSQATESLPKTFPYAGGDETNLDHLSIARTKLRAPEVTHPDTAPSPAGAARSISRSSQVSSTGALRPHHHNSTRPHVMAYSRLHFPALDRRVLRGRVTVHLTSSRGRLKMQCVQLAFATGKSCEYPGRMWKKNPLSRIKRVIARDTTYGVYLLTGTISGSNFAFPRT